MYHDFAWIMLIYRRPYREATILPSFTRIDVRSRNPWWFQDICNSVARGWSLAKKRSEARVTSVQDRWDFCWKCSSMHIKMCVCFLFSKFEICTWMRTRKLPYINFYRNVVDVRTNIARNFEMLYYVFFHNLHSQIVLVKC